MIEPSSERIPRCGSTELAEVLRREASIGGSGLRVVRTPWI
jgi:hypothetical protein